MSNQLGKYNIGYSISFTILVFIVIRNPLKAQVNSASSVVYGKVIKVSYVTDQICLKLSY